MTQIELSRGDVRDLRSLADRIREAAQAQHSILKYSRVLDSILAKADRASDQEIETLDRCPSCGAGQNSIHVEEIWNGAGYRLRVTCENCPAYGEFSKIEAARPFWSRDYQAQTSISDRYDPIGETP